MTSINPFFSCHNFKSFNYSRKKRRIKVPQSHVLTVVQLKPEIVLDNPEKRVCMERQRQLVEDQRLHCITYHRPRVYSGIGYAVVAFPAVVGHTKLSCHNKTHHCDETAILQAASCHGRCRAPNLSAGHALLKSAHSRGL